MKTLRVAFEVLGYAIPFAAAVLHVFGFRLMLPDGAIKPDWDALQALSTIFFSIATLGLTMYIASRQGKLSLDIASKEFQSKQLELKIQLFDKRYKVYECFNKYPLDWIEQFAHAGKNITSLNMNGVQSMKEIVFNSGFIDGRRKALDELRVLESKVTLTGEEQTRLNILRQRMEFENVDFARSETALIEQAEFCFEPAYAQMLVAFINSLFAFALIEFWHNEEEFDKNQKNLLQAIDDIKSSNLVTKLKECLRLSYDEIKNNKS